MSQPRYQEFTSEKLPMVNRDGIWIRVIAGEVDGVRSPIETTVPATMLHLKLDANSVTDLRIAPGSNAILHAIDGNGTFNGKAVTAHNAAILYGSADTVQIASGERGLDALFLAGMPLREPVARYGPFVMSTLDEVQRAFEDYRSGNFGEIARTGA
jgi:redox-sensitive bicupin YhaK (pirin superfamily)